MRRRNTQLSGEGHDPSPGGQTLLDQLTKLDLYPKVHDDVRVTTAGSGILTASVRGVVGWPPPVPLSNIFCDTRSPDATLAARLLASLPTLQLPERRRLTPCVPAPQN